jgi:hypothetical protein
MASDNPKAKVEGLEEKVHVWPYLVRLEFLCAIFVTVGLTVWSIIIDAPLEEAANPTKTPNPSKAPWYFLGLQDILVYFDPWFAGVVAPVLIIVGLMLIPYLDMNPKGNGYYTYHERKVAIWVYAFGFLVLWIALIIMGVFLRGPGWNLFMPWQYWDPHKVVALVSVDLPYAFGVRTYNMAMLFGGVVVGGVTAAIVLSNKNKAQREAFGRDLRYDPCKSSTKAKGNFKFIAKKLGDEKRSGKNLRGK